MFDGERAGRARQRLWRWTPEFRDRTRMVRSAYADAWKPLPRTMGRICVVTVGRAGSELLCDLLDRHPRVVAEGEILRHAPQFTRAFVRGRVHAAARQGAGGYVFKVAALQLVFPRAIQQPSLLFGDLVADGFTFVHLRRRDTLRQALSFVRAKDAGAFHVRDERTASHRGAQIVDPVELISSMSWIEEHDEVISSILAGLPVRRLWYEDDVEDPVARQATLATLFDHLGVEHRSVESDLRQVTPRALGDAVANLDEVLDALRATRFGSHVPAATG